MTSPAPPWQKHALVLLVFAVVAGVLYAPSLSNELVNWDDAEYVLRNPELQQPGLTGVRTIFSSYVLGNYNPLQRLSYWFDWRLGGGEPWVFRLVSLLLHVFNAFLVCHVLRAWLRRDAVAVIAAGVFLVLPANVENVAWVSERKTLLATSFGLLSMAWWLRGRRGLSLASFAVGLLAKTSIVVLPGLLLLFDLQQRRRPRWGWYAAFAAPAVALGVVQVLADSGQEPVPPHGGTAWTHAATAVAALPTYVVSAVVPFGHLPKHLFEPVTSPGDARLWLGLLTWAAAGWGMWRSWRNERRFLCACGFALAALHLTLVVPIPIVTADRYLYLALPLLLGVATAWVLDAPARARVSARLLAGAWVAASLVGTASYAGVWKDSTSLWTHAVERQPRDREAWMSLAAAYGEENELAAAAKVLELTVARFPDFANAGINLAMLEVHLDRPARAIPRLRALLERDRELAAAWSSLAIAYRGQEKNEEALRAFTEGRAHCPDDLPLARNHVQFHLNRGELAEARAAARRFAADNPGDPGGAQLRGMLLEAEGAAGVPPGGAPR